MTLNDYQEFTAETDIYKGDSSMAILMALALGLTEEAGEYAGKIKKAFRDDGGVITHERREAAIKELGDNLWYLARSADRLGCSLNDVALANIEKLTSRVERDVIGGSGDDR